MNGHSPVKCRSNKRTKTSDSGYHSVDIPATAVDQEAGRAKLQPKSIRQVVGSTAVKDGGAVGEDVSTTARKKAQPAQNSEKTWTPGQCESKEQSTTSTPHSVAKPLFLIPEHTQAENDTATKGEAMPASSLHTLRVNGSHSALQLDGVESPSHGPGATNIENIPETRTPIRSSTNGDMVTDSDEQYL